MSEEKDCSAKEDANEPVLSKQDVIILQIAEYRANSLDSRSIDSFCEDINISKGTYYSYQKRFGDRLKSLIIARRRELESSIDDHVHKALIKRIGRSDAAIKIYYQLRGLLDERPTTVVNMMTPEQKKEKIAELMEKLSKQVKTD